MSNNYAKLNARELLINLDCTKHLLIPLFLVLVPPNLPSCSVSVLSSLMGGMETTTEIPLSFETVSASSSVIFGILKRKCKAFKAALFLASFLDEPDPVNFEFKFFIFKESTNKGLWAGPDTLSTSYIKVEKISFRTQLGFFPFRISLIDPGLTFKLVESISESIKTLKTMYPNYFVDLSLRM